MSETNKASPVFSRPGISDAFLARAGCFHCSGRDCGEKFGFKAVGIAIPFRDTNATALKDGDKPFARVRLYNETDNQKYHQRPGSSHHIYVTPDFKNHVVGATLILVEGEFKALALDEAGYCAVGLCGITGAVRTMKSENAEPSHVIVDELMELIESHQPATVVFAGDADVVLNSQFAVEAAKLRRLLFGSRRFSFIQRFFIAKPPIGGPKGFDDCRAELGENFCQWFDSLIAAAYESPKKATSSEIFIDLLTREHDTVKQSLTSQNHDARRARVKLLQSSAALWHETGAQLELKPLLAGLLGVEETKVSGLIKDAFASKSDRGEIVSGQEIRDSGATGGAILFPSIEPWPDPVDGANLLREIGDRIRRYVIAQESAVIAASLFVLHTYAFDLGDISPILFITGPTKRCGKTKLLTVLSRLVSRPLPCAAATAAAIFRVIENDHPTLLADEVDSFVRDNEELRGLFNSGHTRDAAFILTCVPTGGEDGWEPLKFSTWAPKILSGIGRLADTIMDRSVVCPMGRKRKDERVPRLPQSLQFDDLRAKCLRWVQDNAQAVRAACPSVPDLLNDRATDNWTPLVALADLVGGDWPGKAREAAIALSGGEGNEATDMREQLLTDIRNIFKTASTNRLGSKDLVDDLAQIEGRPWAEFPPLRRPISPNQLAKQLKPFGIAPRTIKFPDGTTAKGYHYDQFEEVFARYVPNQGDPDRNPVTPSENANNSGSFETSPPQSELRLENESATLKNAPGYGVTDQNSEMPEADLI